MFGLCKYSNNLLRYKLERSNHYTKHDTDKVADNTLLINNSAERTRFTMVYLKIVSFLI